MGCSSSKDAVQSIEIKDGKVRKTSAKRIKVVSSDENLVNESNAVHISGKSKSAKSRDSGIGEMDEEHNASQDDAVITEDSHPHLVQNVEKGTRPLTPNLSLVGRQFQSKSAGRARSKAILEELEAEGLISGTKVEKGGAAFEVRVAPLEPLEPLAPIKRPPPRLERLKSERRLPSKAELEEKMKLAEERRKETLQRRSRLASQLTRDQALAAKLNPDAEDDENMGDGLGAVTSSRGHGFERGQGEDKHKKKTIFDEQSVDSLEATINGGMRNSNDYNNSNSSINDPFS